MLFFVARTQGLDSIRIPPKSSKAFLHSPGSGRDKEQFSCDRHKFALITFSRRRIERRTLRMSLLPALIPSCERAWANPAASKRLRRHSWNEVLPDFRNAWV